MAKAKKYACEEECYWNNRLWVPGEEYCGVEKPPKHFVPAEKAVPLQEEGSDLDQPMTLKEGQKAVLGETKLSDGSDPKNLKEANEMFG